MLESGEVLLTWQLFADPKTALPPIPARRIGDHRKAYLSYEGPIGGDRGVVTRVEQGTYRILSVDARGYLLQLEGTWLRGPFELLQAEGQGWSLVAGP